MKKLLIIIVLWVVINSLFSYNLVIPKRVKSQNGRYEVSITYDANNHAESIEDLYYNYRIILRDNEAKRNVWGWIVKEDDKEPEDIYVMNNGTVIIKNRKEEYYSVDLKKNIELIGYLLINEPVDKATGLFSKTECTYGGYRITTLDYEYESYLVIIKEGSPVYAAHSHRYYIGAMREKDDKIINKYITGEGQANLIIYEWTGGAHCAYIAHIFETGDNFNKIAAIDGDHGIPKIIDVNNDNISEIKIFDWTFAYWNACFADSPAGEVIFKYFNGKYVVATELMKKPEPSKEEYNVLLKKHKEIEWNNPFRGEGYVPPEIWGCMLDLIYSGNSKYAWKLLEDVWQPAAKENKDEFKKRFITKLATSPYWSDILKLNENDNTFEISLKKEEEIKIKKPQEDIVFDEKTMITIHTIEKGETLAGIAKKYYGKSSYWIKIIKANPGIIPNELNVGDKLTIPKLK